MAHGMALYVSLSCAVCGLALLAPTPARSGAWTQPKGHGQVIVSGLYTEAMEAFDGKGSAAAIPVFRKAELSVYAEYGLAERLTAIARTELKTGAAGTSTALEDARFGLSGLGARLRLFEENGAVVSIEAMGLLPTGQGARRWEGDPDAEIDLRLLLGHGFTLGNWSGFADLQGAYRLRPGAEADEIRGDATLGVRPRPRLLWLVQSFNTFSVGHAADHREHKAEVSVVYDLTQNVSVQLGGIATVAGANALRERGFVTALWLRF